MGRPYAKRLKDSEHLSGLVVDSEDLNGLVVDSEHLSGLVVLSREILTVLASAFDGLARGSQACGSF